jgi:hypothetical protein
MEDGITMEEHKFVNGFTSWIETYHEVVSFMTLQYERDADFSSRMSKVNEERGTRGWYELAEELTNKFENLHKGRKWDGDFFDEIEYFLTKELNDYGK